MRVTKKQDGVWLHFQVGSRHAALHLSTVTAGCRFMIKETIDAWADALPLGYDSNVAPGQLHQAMSLLEDAVALVEHGCSAEIVYQLKEDAKKLREQVDGRAG